MYPSKEYADSGAEEILRAVLDDESKKEDTATENSEWINARMSECYND